VNLANKLRKITFSKFSVKSFLAKPLSDHLSDLSTHLRQHFKERQMNVPYHSMNPKPSSSQAWTQTFPRSAMSLQGAQGASFQQESWEKLASVLGRLSSTKICQASVQQRVKPRHVFLWPSYLQENQAGPRVFWLPATGEQLSI